MYPGIWHSHYSTNITDNASFVGAADKFVVRKTKFTVSDDGDMPQWSTLEEKYTVWVAKEKFAYGKTKYAFKVFGIF